MLQQQALDILKLGHNVFLTGAAGAGKTYVLNQYIDYLKNNNVHTAITASTGIAATHLQGMTIHAWSGIGIKDSLSKKDLKKIFETDRIRRNYQKTKVLIIDEVSMLHKHQLDMVDQIARFVLCNDTPFGGIQVVLCGDFFQLPPVSPNKDVAFAFESDAWASGNFQVCYLSEQHRQKNDELLTILNDIRSGTAGEHTKVPLRKRYKKEPEGATKPTKLYSRNINVDVINNKELANLSEKEKIFTMTSSGYRTKIEALKKSCLALEALPLKVGAEVMFIKNDPLGYFVNGTRATVIGFNKTDGYPIVKTYANQKIVAEPEEWVFEENGKVQAIIKQVPLRLAWAITIHKSQGMTLDAAEMDLGDTFEPGMGYVALSRVRSLSGLKLMNLNEMALTVHPKILQLDKSLKDQSDAIVANLKELSESDKVAQQAQIITERFEASKSKPIKKIAKNKIPTHLVTLQHLTDGLTLQEIAKKREFTIGTIVSHIEKLHQHELLDDITREHIKKTLPLKDFNRILKAFDKSSDGRLLPVYEKLKGKYDYDSLRLVRLFIT